MMDKRRHGGEGDMWPYKNYAEEDYNRVITFVQDYAVSLGAKLMVSKEEKSAYSFLFTGTQIAL